MILQIKNYSMLASQHNSKNTMSQDFLSLCAVQYGTSAEFSQVIYVIGKWHSWTDHIQLLINIKETV